jgi:hypothetical protein
MADLIKKEQVPNFTEKELVELNEYLDKGGLALSDATANKFYNLFFEGKTMADIFQGAPAYSRGSILLARYQQGWDDKRKKDFVDKVSRLPEKVMQAKIDLIEHLTEQISIAKIQFDKEARIYKQNPTPENFPKNLVFSPKDLKEIVGALNEAIKIGKEDVGTGPAAVINVINNGSGNKVIDITPQEKAGLLKEAAKKNESN